MQSKKTIEIGKNLRHNDDRGKKMRPEAEDFYGVDFVAEGEFCVQFIDSNGKDSFKTKHFPAGTRVMIFISRKPQGR